MRSLQAGSHYAIAIIRLILVNGVKLEEVDRFSGGGKFQKRGVILPFCRIFRV
jgi:hypothetical protein